MPLRLAHTLHSLVRVTRRDGWCLHIQHQVTPHANAPKPQRTAHRVSSINSYQDRGTLRAAESHRDPVDPSVADEGSKPQPSAGWCPPPTLGLSSTSTTDAARRDDGMHRTKDSIHRQWYLTAPLVRRLRRPSTADPSPPHRVRAATASLSAVSSFC
jgi:hypothetical protein